MTLDEFRLTHSELIEHYQFIEHHLEGIFAFLQGKDHFEKGMQEVENDNIPRLLKKIKETQDEYGEIALSKEDFDLLERLCARRNFWCHNCYVDMVFDRMTEGPKKENDVEKMKEDLREAQRVRNYLFETKIKVLEKMRNKK